jgi:hypothetical protein
MISDLTMKQRFLDAMHTRLKRAVQLQIMPEDTLDTILTIAEMYDIANHATGIYRHPRSIQRASKATVQAKTKQQLAPTQTSNFGHPQNPPCQKNLQQY